MASAATSASTGVYNTNADIVTTPVLGSNGSFFVVRHSNYSSENSTSYTLSLPTSAGNISIPQLGGSLALNGRDSKVHVTDYPVGDSNLLYSTAEIFTWQKFDNKTVLVVYGGPNELHELAVVGTTTGSLVEGDHVTIQQSNSSVVIQWETSTDRKIVQIGDLYIYILGTLPCSSHNNTVHADHETSPQTATVPTTTGCQSSPAGPPSSSTGRIS